VIQTFRKSVKKPEGNWEFMKMAPEGECSFCDEMREKDCDFFPNHTAMYFCESGRRDHCTCDRCF
jgi:hypothetical protein